MADTKITDLPALAAPSSDDLVVVVDDPGGTPTDKKATVGSIKASPSQSAITSASSVPNTTQTDVPGSSITINPGASSNVLIVGQISVSNTSASGRVDIQLVKDGSAIAFSYARIANTNMLITIPIVFLDTGVSGSHTYKLQYSDQLAAGGTVTIQAAPASNLSAVIF